MSLNFFGGPCQEPSTTTALFGLCDDQDGTKAYTSTLNRCNWIATVKNDNGVALTFTAIDKCVIQDYEEPGRGRCDGMLTSTEHIYFVELKAESKNWISGAIEQLESTVQFFIDNHDLSIFKYKKAFACNKKHRRFQEIDNEFNLYFFRTYGVRIDIQGEIIVI